MEELINLFGSAKVIGFAGADQEELAALKEKFALLRSAPEPDYSSKIDGAYISYGEPTLVRKWIQEWTPVVKRGGIIVGGGWNIEHYGLQRMLAEEYHLLLVNVHGNYWWVIRP